MRIGFAGTSPFAAQILAHLLEEKRTIQWVLTRPDSRAGRGKQLRPSAVKELAVARGLQLYQPEGLEPSFVKQLAGAAPDLIIVVAYGLLLPPGFLQLPRLGCVNIHTSLLPRWRGAAPIERAIEAGDKESGISLFRIVKELDAGPILSQKSCPIAADDTAAELAAKLELLSCAAISEYLDAPDAYPPRAQDESRATYAHKISKEEAQVNWQEPAAKVAKQINAFSPNPGAYSWLGDSRVKILQAVINEEAGAVAASTEKLGAGDESAGSAKAAGAEELSAQTETAPQQLAGSFIYKDKELIVSCAPNSSIKILRLQFPGKSAINPNQIQGASPLDQHQSFSSQ